MKFIPNAVTVKAARTVLVGKKHSPQTLFIGGLVGMGATVVLACRATLRVEAVLENHEVAMAAIEEASNSGATDVKKTKSRIYFSTLGDFTKLYGPTIICGSVSVAALAGSHNILTKRNAALAAAYGTVQKAFEDYRERVSKEIGPEREKELYHDVEVCEIEDEVTGKKSKVKRANGGSPYARLFDNGNANWERTPEYNVTFLKLQQNAANQRLHARGHLFLNEVYEALGLSHTKAGAVVGWMDGEGDDYIDFGIFNESNAEKFLDFMTGREKGIWLDFNVDGVIYDKI